jgi:hypothetical protein
MDIFQNWLHVILKGGSEFFVPQTISDDPENTIILPVQNVFDTWANGGSGRHNFTDFPFPVAIDLDEVQTMVIRPFSGDPYIQSTRLVADGEHEGNNGSLECGHTQEEHDNMQQPPQQPPQPEQPQV